MENAKFRDFLTKRSEEPSEGGKASAADTAEERAKRKAKQQASYERRMAIQKRREAALEEANRYVDRAAERRREEARQRKEGNDEDGGAGASGAPFYADFHDAAAEAGQSVSDAPTFAQLGDREDLSQQQHRLSIAQSKYLGGDIEHTHLVKGLDYALLQKMRSELASTAEKEKEEAEGTAKKAAARAAQQSARPAAKRLAPTHPPPPSVKSTSKAKAVVASAKEMTFASDMGRELHRILHGAGTARPNRALIDGRLVLVYDMSADGTLACSTTTHPPIDIHAEDAHMQTAPRTPGGTMSASSIPKPITLTLIQAARRAQAQSRARWFARAMTSAYASDRARRGTVRPSQKLSKHASVR